MAIAPVVITGGHFVVGGGTNIQSAVLVLALAGILLIRTLRPDAREALESVPALWSMGLLFGGVMILAGLSLTSWAPGGPHPIWAMTGSDVRAGTLNRFQTTMEMIKLTGLACAFLLGILQGWRPDHARRTVHLILTIGAVYAMAAILMLGTGTQALVTPRLTGGFLSPNSAATVFGVLTVIGTGVGLRQWRRSGGAGWRESLATVGPIGAALALFATCLLLTGSRAGLAATVGAMLILLAWQTATATRRTSALWLAVAVFAVLAFSAIGGWGQVLGDRLGSIGVDAEVRRGIMSAHWRAFLDAPGFGHGLGSFRELNAMAMTEATYADLWPIRSAHNVYLQWLEEAGLAGSAAMFSLIGLVIWIGLRRAASARRGTELARGLVAANVVVLLHGMTDYALQEPSIAALWAFLLGLQVAWGAEGART
ncbi:O-antigen ligase family protein [Brevundimonas sp. VNH65]|uniref:O-antigen ligase family protein n=1 Tax=Brevundimonas sp. VNH65 TaxID=3400917 RepID=UPI003C06112E